MNNKFHKWQETHSYWYQITGAADQHLPDADATVLVYDSHLEDVMFATAEVEEDPASVNWVDINTAQPLPNPTWWAEVPFPKEI